MEKEIKKINKPSAMIQTNVKDLTLTQRKIINFLIYVAQQEGDQRFYSTNISTIKQMCKIKKTENINFKDQFRALKKIDIEFNYLNKDKNNVWQLTGVLCSAEVIENSGKLIFEIPYMLKDKILNPNIYTPLNILLIAGLKSKYSIVLYELLRDYLNSPVFPKLTIDNLRELLGVENGKYKLFKDLKKWVIDKAIEEINKKTDIRCSYTLIKTKGNRYSHIQFNLRKNTNFKINDSGPKHLLENNLHLFFDKTTLPKEVLEILPEEYQINSIYHQIEPYFNDLNFLISNIEYCNKNCDKNYSAYLKKTLENDYAKVNREVKEKKDKIVQEKKNQIQEEKNQEKLLKQKAWDYFNSLPEVDQFKFRTEAEEKMSAPLKIFKASDRKNDIINAQIEKDIIRYLKMDRNV
ncbi:replication initiation protein [bacterium]|nr:replication initiation protein [bacterium]